MALCYYVQILYFDYYYCTFALNFFFVRGIPSCEILAPPLHVELVSYVLCLWIELFLASILRCVDMR